MHLYLAVRGVKRFVNRWKEDVETLYLPSDRADKRSIQLCLRPIQLFEVVYPEGQHNTVLKILEIRDEGKYGAVAEKIFKWIRRFLKLEKVKLPVVEDKDKVIHSNSRRYVGVHVIGSKKDDYEIKKQEIL